MMTPKFWALIERTRPKSWDPASQAAAITASLVEAGVDETVGFAAAFDTAIDALYTWDLWGAAYLAFGGCSDDSFEFLRAWIIGAGESAWSTATGDPERLFMGLLDGADDPERRWDELAIHDGEPLLYAAGVAHERLTDEWLPGRGSRPSEPSGEDWEEERLPELFPELFELLPEDWWGEDEEASDDAVRVMLQVDTGVDSFSEGDHLGAGALLASLVDDPVQWALVSEDRRVDVAYVVGIGRLLSGDVEGASAALHLVESRLTEADHVRRALAQVEMARGHLDNASRWIDRTEEASRYDRVLAAKLAWRRGDHRQAILLATAEMATSIESDEHPWDVAGSAYQIGQIFAEAGDVDGAIRAAGVMTRFLGDAPGDLPLLTHLQLLVAAISRLQGEPREALRLLGLLRLGLNGTELAECLREEARAHRALSNAGQATSFYEASIAAFQAAGERWEAGATHAESTETPNQAP